MRVSWLAIGFLATSVIAAPAQAAPGYRVVERFAGPDGGWDYVRVDAANNRVLVAHGTSVTAFDLATGRVTAGLAPGARLHDALPVNDGRELLVTDGGSGTVNFVDAGGGAVATVPAGKNPDAAAFDAASGLVLVMNHSGGDITLVDPKAHKAVGTIKVGGDLEAAAVDGAGRAYVNVEDKDEIAVIDIAGRKVVGRYPLAGCEGPTGLAYDPATHWLLAACDGATAVVEAASGKVLQTLPTGKGADGVALDAGRRLAFVSAGHDGTLSVIGLAAGGATLLETVATQVGARTVAVDVRTGRVYSPVAERGPPEQADGRPSIVPGTFKLLVVGK